MFEPIEVKWGERSYKLQPDGILRAIADVEDVLTIGELYVYQARRDTLPLAKLALAYATLLRHAGAQVTAEQVYAAMFSGDDLQSRAISAIQTLQMLMIPPSALRERAAPGKPEAAGERAASSPNSSSS